MTHFVQGGRLLGLQLFAKRLCDIVGSLLLMLITLPITLLISLAICLEDGLPVIFVQNRLGVNARIFPMLKFRSMRLNSQVFYNTDGSTRVDQTDPRVTRVGHLLRRTSLDELPQLVNVLLGQMSLIGPRPDLPEHLTQYNDFDRLKLRMRPGITGLPQVSGRNDLAWKDRIKMDVHYIDQYSLWLDIRICILTVRAVATGRGVVGKR